MDEGAGLEHVNCVASLPGYGYDAACDIAQPLLQPGIRKFADPRISRCNLGHEDHYEDESDSRGQPSSR